MLRNRDKKDSEALLILERWAQEVNFVSQVYKSQMRTRKMRQFKFHTCGESTVAL